MTNDTCSLRSSVPVSVYINVYCRLLISNILNIINEISFVRSTTECHFRYWSFHFRCKLPTWQFAARTARTRIAPNPGAVALDAPFPPALPSPSYSYLVACLFATTLLNQINHVSSKGSHSIGNELHGELSLYYKTKSSEPIRPDLPQSTRQRYPQICNSRWQPTQSVSVRTDRRK